MFTNDLLESNSYFGFFLLAKEQRKYHRNDSLYCVYYLERY